MNGLLTNFIAVIMTATTGFTSSFVEVNMAQPREQVQTIVQTAIDEGTSIAHSSGMEAGIAVIDRAKNNSMKTNAESAHKQFPLESLGRLPILIYAAITDREVAKDNVPEIVSMMQGYSGEATKQMWEKYGSEQIIRDLSERYNLQETTANSTWGTSTSSAVDIGRLIRRFLDDDRVNINTKKWVISLLRDTSLSVSGTDFSFGLPAARGLNNTESSESVNNKLAWVQGSTTTGSDPMIRSTSGILDDNMRYIVVILGEVSSNTSDNDADTIISQVATAVAGDEALTGDAETTQEDPDVEKFNKKQKKLYGSFVNIENYSI